MNISEILLAFAIVAAVGCGGDGDSDDGTTDTTGTGGGTGGTGGTGGGTCTPVTVTCADFCAETMSTCMDNWPDNVACEADCATWEAGCVEDTDGNTLGCRDYHLGAAAADAATHCPHAGADGGGVCI
jgi:hypothetical protein